VWINKATKKDSYHLPFFYEVLNIIARYEAYSFLDGYVGYHQIFIALEDIQNDLCNILGSFCLDGDAIWC